MMMYMTFKHCKCILFTSTTTSDYLEVFQAYMTFKGIRAFMIHRHKHTISITNSHHKRA